MFTSLPPSLPSRSVFCLLPTSRQAVLLDDPTACLLKLTVLGLLCCDFPSGLSWKHHATFTAEDSVFAVLRISDVLRTLLEVSSVKAVWEVCSSFHVRKRLHKSAVLLYLVRILLL